MTTKRRFSTDKPFVSATGTVLNVDVPANPVINLNPGKPPSQTDVQQYKQDVSSEFEQRRALRAEKEELKQKRQHLMMARSAFAAEIHEQEEDIRKRQAALASGQPLARPPGPKPKHADCTYEPLTALNETLLWGLSFCVDWSKDKHGELGKPPHGAEGEASHGSTVEAGHGFPRSCADIEKAVDWEAIGYEHSHEHPQAATVSNVVDTTATHVVGNDIADANSGGVALAETASGSKNSGNPVSQLGLTESEAENPSQTSMSPQKVGKSEAVSVIETAPTASALSSGALGPLAKAKAKAKGNKDDASVIGGSDSARSQSRSPGASGGQSSKRKSSGSNPNASVMSVKTTSASPAGDVLGPLLKAQGGNYGGRTKNTT